VSLYLRVPGSFPGPVAGHQRLYLTIGDRSRVSSRGPALCVFVVGVHALTHITESSNHTHVVYRGNAPSEPEANLGIALAA